MKMLQGLLVLVMGMFSLTAMGQQPTLVPQAEPAFVLSNRGAILQLIETLLHIPYVATVDSTNVTAIKASAALAFVGNDFRLMQQLLTTRQDASALRVLLTAAPKVLGYVLAAWYDMARMQQTDRIAKDNKNDAKLLRQFKANQTVLLVFELVLRIMVVAASYTGLTRDSWMQWGVGQVADWVGLWRLISRYFTILLVLERFELSITTQSRLPDGVVRAAVPDKHALFANDLAAFAQIVHLPAAAAD